MDITRSSMFSYLHSFITISQFYNSCFQPGHIDRIECQYKDIIFVIKFADEKSTKYYEKTTEIIMKIKMYNIRESFSFE
jgi:hypothetical protein